MAAITYRDPNVGEASAGRCHTTMSDKLLECPSAGCTWTTRETSEFTAHINEEHPVEFQRDDWLTFSNPESAQFQSGIRREQTTGSDDEDEVTDDT